MQDKEGMDFISELARTWSAFYTVTLTRLVSYVQLSPTSGLCRMLFKCHPPTGLSHVLFKSLEIAWQVTHIGHIAHLWFNAKKTAHTTSCSACLCRYFTTYGGKLGPCIRPTTLLAFRDHLLLSKAVRPAFEGMGLLPCYYFGGCCISKAHHHCVVGLIGSCSRSSFHREAHTYGQKTSVFRTDEWPFFLAFTFTCTVVWFHYGLR